jgi:hypothetical protein
LEHNHLTRANSGGLNGAKCYCGKKIIETFISGPSIERIYRQKTKYNLKVPDIIKQAIADNFKSRGCFKGV